MVGELLASTAFSASSLDINPLNRKIVIPGTSMLRQRELSRGNSHGRRISRVGLYLEDGVGRGSSRLLLSQDEDTSPR